MLSLGIEVEKRSAQKIHSELLQHSLLSGTLKPLRTKATVIFPLAKRPAKKELSSLKKIARVSLVKKKFGERKAPKTWKEALEGKLSKKEMAFVPSSFDSLGNVAIIEVPKDLKGRKRILGKALLESHKSFESVFAKTGAHTGIFREEPVKLVAGKKTRFATYREHGCTFRITLGKVFFSPRLSTERKRIAALIKSGEKVAALFAGVGPFPIVFAKHSKMEKVVAIELNPAAYKDMLHNIKANKVHDMAEAIFGDVKELSYSPEYVGKFDRTVMPLPKGGEDFLEDAIRYIKPAGGVVHYYQFVPRENPYEVQERQIAQACARLGRRFEILFRRQVREYAPDIIQVVVDFRVWEGNGKIKGNTF